MQLCLRNENIVCLVICFSVGNPWPPVVPHVRDISGSLLNVLLQEARKEYHSDRKSKVLDCVAGDDLVHDEKKPVAEDKPTNCAV